MSRTTLALFLLTLAAAPLRAEDEPAPVQSGGDARKDPALINPDAVKAQSDELHDAVANPAIDNFAIRDKAAGFFEGLQRETPLVRPAHWRMDREDVDGRVGTVEGMLDAAQKRYDHWKLTTTEVPPPGLERSIDYAKEMRGDKRADFDKTGKMAENQMGEFRYAPGAVDRGLIEINGRMALIATRIGEAFSYATLVHEATHARAHADGRLSPEQVIDGEVEAYRVQYHWLKILDPRAQRMIMLTAKLNAYLRLHPEDEVARASVVYVRHLLALWDTEGDDRKLRDLVKGLGYEDGDAGRPGGVSAAATGPRV